MLKLVKLYFAIKTHWFEHVSCMIQIIETSEVTEPLTFEVGAGEVMGNKMFQVQLCSVCHVTHSCHSLYAFF